MSYAMWYARGMTNDEVPQHVLDRAIARLNKEDGGCWTWPGSKTAGYGRIGWKAETGMKYGMVHRIVYTGLVGPIGAGLDLDHMCHDPETCTAPAAQCPHRKCANPEHMRPSTRQENLLRGAGAAAMRAKITHCPLGHEYAGENLFHDKLGRRLCRECVRMKNRAYYHANKERRSLYNKQWREAQKSV